MYKTKSCLKIRKKTENKFCINFHLKDRLQIHSLLKRADASESAVIIYLICDLVVVG